MDSLFVHCLRLCFWGSIPANQNAQLSKRFWITTSSAVLDRHTAEGCKFTVPENCNMKWLEWSTWQLIAERNFLQTISGTVHQRAQSHEVFAMSHPHHFQGALRFLSWWSGAGRAIRPALGICVAWHGCRAYCMQPKGTQFEHRKHQPIMIWDDPFLRRSEMCIRFFGEEISMSARLWTSGWDFFHPTSEFFGGTFFVEWCNSCWVILLVKCGRAPQIESRLMPVKSKIITHLKVNQTTSSETYWMCWSLNWNLRIAYHLASRAHRYWFREVQSTPEQLHREKQGKFSDFAARYWHNDVPLLETGAIGFCESAGICGLLGTPWPDHHLPPEKPYGVGSQRTLAEYEGAISQALV